MKTTDSNMMGDPLKLEHWTTSGDSDKFHLFSMKR